MKQAMIALFYLICSPYPIDIKYSGKKRVFYIKNEFGENMTMGDRMNIPLTVGTFYGLAKRSGIQSPTAFALSINKENLVKKRFIK